MAFPDLAVNAIYTVLCLVPGFISVKTATYAGGIDAELTEFEKSTWSFLASGASLSMLYFVYVLWMGLVTGRFTLVRSLDIGWVHVVVVYPVLLAVAFVVGLVSALLYGRTLGGPTAVWPDTPRQ